MKIHSIVQNQQYILGEISVNLLLFVLPYHRIMASYYQILLVPLWRGKRKTKKHSSFTHICILHSKLLLGSTSSTDVPSVHDKGNPWYPAGIEMSSLILV